MPLAYKVEYIHISFWEIAEQKYSQITEVIIQW